MEKLEILNKIEKVVYVTQLSSVIIAVIIFMTAKFL